MRESNKIKKEIEKETSNRLFELAQEKIEQLELNIAKQQDKIDEQEKIEDSLLKDEEKFVKLYQEGSIDSHCEPK